MKGRANTRVLALATVVLLATSAGAQGPADTARRALFGDPVFVGMITNPAIREASGLACSRRRDDILWVLNDSGNPPALYAVTTNGASIASFSVAGVANQDWEDLASFRLDDQPLLLIGDVGDNKAKRPVRSLHVVREPDLSAAETSNIASLPLVWSTHFRYEDGPRDCESVAVDPSAGKVFLLSKRTQPPVLYETPLRPSRAGTITSAVRVGEMRRIPQSTQLGLRELWGKIVGQPTAMDMSPDGMRLVVLTYTDAYLYTRLPDSGWADKLADAPERITLPSRAKGIMLGREALCFGPDGQVIYVTSEGSPAPLYRIDAVGLVAGPEE